MKLLGSVAAWVSGLVTVTPTVAAIAAAVTHVSEVEESTLTLVACAVPTRTVAPTWNVVPVRVSVVPPAVVPTAGVTPVSVGTGAYR